MVGLKSTLFHVDPASWLGARLDSGRQETCSIGMALAYECKPNKHEQLPAGLEYELKHELGVIDGLPDTGVTLRGDRVEKARAAEHGEEMTPSVDIYLAVCDGLLLAECKYKAKPETQIVKSVEAFRQNVGRKFESSIAFLQQQGAKEISGDRAVLFNAESKEKVLSMFRRLQLEGVDESLLRYQIMDTQDFWVRYHGRIVNSAEVA